MLFGDYKIKCIVFEIEILKVSTKMNYVDFIKIFRMFSSFSFISSFFLILLILGKVVVLWK